jgi:hypothetical protein
MNEKYLQTVLLLLFFSSLHSRPLCKYINYRNEKANKMKVLFTIAIALAALFLSSSPATAAGTQLGRRLKKVCDSNAFQDPVTGKCYNLKDKKVDAEEINGECYEKKAKWVYDGADCYAKKEECTGPPFC